MYKVKQEENYKQIANFYGLSVEKVKFANKEKKIKAGDLITIPIPSSHLYQLKKGETLYKLSRQFGVEVEKLIKLNNIKDSRNIPSNYAIIFPKPIR